jgi:ABC-2 type transport system permease protein
MNTKNIYHLGIKEIKALLQDPVMIFFIVYAFTLGIYTSATAKPDVLKNTPIAIIDEDKSPLSQRISNSFYPPMFTNPDIINAQEMDKAMDKGKYTFALNIPPYFQRDVLQGKDPAIQLNIDATRMGQAFSGGGYVQNIALKEIYNFLAPNQSLTSSVDLNTRTLFNPNRYTLWFGAINEIINKITMLSIVITGAALIREREHGTIEHLLVMPITPVEIMFSKIWPMALVVFTVATFALLFIVQMILHIPLNGSLPLFLFCMLLQLWATTSLGIFLSTISKTMPQFGLLLVLLLLPLQILSGGVTPRESMPTFIQNIMLIAPNTHFVKISQAILFRGAGIEVIWPSVIALIMIGSGLFFASLYSFKRNGLQT